MLPRRWFILNYHEVSWEENVFLRPIGGTMPPDLFEEHVRHLGRLADVVTPEEGARMMSAGRIRRPLVTFWFDDGLAGVRRYALPILRGLGHRAAVSVNSALSLRRETFWRFELAYLSSVNALPAFRRRLAEISPRPAPRALLRDWTLRNFSMDLRERLHESFRSSADAEVTRRCMGMYDDFAGFKALCDEGWTIANHTARHFPVSAPGQLGMFAREFLECSGHVGEALGSEPRHWVLPFDYLCDPGLDSAFDSLNPARSLVMVRVGNRSNRPGQRPDRLWRITAPAVRGPQLARLMAAIQ